MVVEFDPVIIGDVAEAHGLEVFGAVFEGAVGEGWGGVDGPGGVGGWGGGAEGAGGPVAGLAALDGFEIEERGGGGGVGGGFFEGGC